MSKEVEDLMERQVEILGKMAETLQRISEELGTLNRYREYENSSPYRQREMLEEQDVDIRFPRRHGVDMGDE